jgi:MFS family permease
MIFGRRPVSLISDAITMAISLFAVGLTGFTAFTVAATFLGVVGGWLGLLVGFFAGVYSFPFWIAGLFLVGWPTCILLGYDGRRDRRAVLTTGAVVAAISAPSIAWALLAYLRTPLGLFTAAATAVIAIPAAAGGLVSAWTLWRLSEQRRVS